MSKIQHEKLSKRLNRKLRTPTAVPSSFQPLGSSLLNGWDEDATVAPVGFLRRDGLVHLRGAVGGGTTGTVAFILPEGAWPAHKQRIATICNGLGPARVEISPSGSVLIGAGDTTWVSLDGLSYRVGA